MSTRDHFGAATRSAFLCESGARICRRHAEAEPVHAVKAPLQRPDRQAAQLVELAVEHHEGTRAEAIAYVRQHICDEVAEGDPRVWAVEGHDGYMIGTHYHALVLREIDLIASREQSAPA